jgi:hypothetical protein
MDIVDRLYHHLTLSLERGGAALRGRELTIADVYQQLIPYRSVRGELGIWELAEYEHGLVRLLAGERGYLSVQKPEVREELLREIASPNPILGIYRDYATEPVQIGGSAPVASPTPASPRAPAAPEAARGCHSCGTALPDLPALRFCPACGADQTEVACRACDAPLKTEWNFCIRCGAPRDGGDRRERAAR